MTFPFLHTADHGPGRLTEVATFKRSAITTERYNEVFESIAGIIFKFPVSRQLLIGSKAGEADISVLVGDWTSAEEKDEFEPGEQYQSVKPAFAELIDEKDPKFTCHHIILDGGAERTPAAAVYAVIVVKTPVDKQAELYSVFSSMRLGDADVTFAAAAPSREDPETVVLYCGFTNGALAHARLQTVRDSESLRPYVLATAHLLDKMEETIRPLGQIESSYTATLMRLF
ncbi:hypothetical protein NA57DRAFT_60123 [Rhizodiscina lignyota]|uniref:ABM domain-containing protein n=1 Tax=Rhizodiscina lignyota TaxID=1504668 RepID=A0A9P4M6C7_9PEZI|nr:hypothetical protein NA57DRAFT_60123 [Rhizodiscina lignyota]